MNRSPLALGPESPDAQTVQEQVKRCVSDGPHAKGSRRSWRANRKTSLAFHFGAVSKVEGAQNAYPSYDYRTLEYR